MDTITITTPKTQPEFKGIETGTTPVEICNGDGCAVFTVSQ